MYQKNIMQSITLPQEIIDEILSYGDPFVTQKMEKVLFQLKYHSEKFNEMFQTPMYWFNPYYGYTNEMFYRFMLKKKPIHWIPPSMSYETSYRTSYRTSSSSVLNENYYTISTSLYLESKHVRSIMKDLEWGSMMINLIYEPKKLPYEFIPFNRRYARIWGKPYKKGGKGRGKYLRGNYSKIGNKNN